jgi:hypothetical protein
MKYHLYKSWQVTFANTYARRFAMDVDHLYDQFIDACDQAQGAFLTLSTSQPMRIEVLQSFPDVDGNDLTLAAKQNFDPTTCPIVANVINQLAVKLATLCELPVKEVEAAVQNVIYDDWEPLIDITKDQIADEAILKLLKAELMVAV